MEDREKEKEEEEDNESTLDPLSTSFDPLRALYSSEAVISDPDAEVLQSLDQYLVNPRDENFDPEVALYSQNTIVPVPNAPIFDNISKFISHLNPRKNVPKPGKSGDTQGPSTSSQTETQERRFLPHQMPVRSTRPRRELRNVLTRMEAAKEGPLSLLKDCMERRVRIKVFTRNMCGVRGYCIAFVAAFDKHWNLALEDVTEVWTRKKLAKTKVPALGAEPPAPVAELTWEGLPRPRPPRVLVRKTSRKSEECERHVGQLLVRGEQVALIAVMP